MGELPRISIVIPSFNQARYIEETIQSIINQNYPKLELIIIDGGSTDGSIAVIEKYARHLSYWHSSPDKGQTDALIQGFKLATGNLIGWINSDDVMLSHSLACIASAFMSDPEIELFFGNFLLIDDNGSIISCKRVPVKRIKWFAKRGHWVFSSIGTFFSKRAYEVVGGLNAELTYVMDADLLMRMVLNGIRYFHVGQYISTFRRHNLAKTVYGAKESKDEHHYAAEKYWPSEVADGLKQNRWRFMYWVYQIVNGNYKMFIDTAKYRKKNWRSLRY